MCVCMLVWMCIYIYMYVCFFLCTYIYTSAGNGGTRRDSKKTAGTPGNPCKTQMGESLYLSNQFQSEFRSGGVEKRRPDSSVWMRDPAFGLRNLSRIRRGP